VGQAREQSVIDSEWRSEGIGVLMWALGRFELPRYDESRVEDLPTERIGFLSPVADADSEEPAWLRPVSEIDHFRAHTTIVHWRLTQFRASRDSALYEHASQEFPGRSGVQESIAFVRYLQRHPSFQEYWLDGLQFIDDDLAIGGCGIAAASPAEVKKCVSIARERQIAACWLLGDDEFYSKVEPATLLSSC
jgi:hypothetical protein